MTHERPTGSNRTVNKVGLWLLVILVASVLAGIATLLAVGLVAFWLLSHDVSPPPPSAVPARFDYDLASYMNVDPALVAYRQAAVLPVDLRVPRAIAVGPGDTIHVAGDQSLVVLDAQGWLLRRIELDDTPRALAVDAQGNRFVAFENYVSIVDNRGKPTARWRPAGPRAVFTSIALDGDDVFVADAGNRCVLRYDRSGRMTGKLAERDDERGVPALVIRSPYFDVAIGTDGLLRVVNPGRRRIEFFTRDGHYEAPLAWGRSGMAVDRFCGCCNPIAIALLADNEVVTAEKAIPRVKVYTLDGRFECVVATPEQLGATQALLEETRPEHKLLAVDLATDSRNRILVLDPAAHAVRVFVKKENAKDK